MPFLRASLFGFISAVLVVQGLAGIAVAAVNPAQATLPTALHDMPCEGEQAPAPSHDPACDMGCDSAPDSQDFDPAWAPAWRSPSLDMPDAALPSAGFRQFAAARRHPVRTAPPRGPPLRKRADSPVARADRLLN